MQIYQPSHTYLNLANASKRNGLQSQMSYSFTIFYTHCSADTMTNTDKSLDNDIKFTVTAKLIF